MPKQSVAPKPTPAGRPVGRPKVQKVRSKVSVTIPAGLFASAQKKAFSSKESFSSRVSRALENLAELEGAQ